MNTRSAALQVVEDVLRRHEFLHLALKKISLPNLRDQRFLTALVNAVLENLFRIDYVLSQYIQVRKTDPIALNILRLGAAQILFLGGVADHAAVSESVALAAKRCPRLKGLVNAVLRRLVRERDDIRYPDPEEEPARYLHVFYSYPLWICEKYIADYGYDTAEKIIAYRGDPEITRIRLTDRCTDRENYTPGIYLDDAAVLRGTGRLDGREDFQNGAITAQSESSMLCVRAAGIGKTDRILDLCAAPGGKTCYAAQLAEQGHVTACDLHAHRAGLIRETASRLGLANVSVLVQDARSCRDEWHEAFDTVLVDAPCSALGLLYRKPDIKIFKKEEDLFQLQQIQRDILRCAQQYVAPGGVLVYSTCTIDRLENEDNAAWFLENHPQFHLGDLGARLPGRIGEQAATGTIQLLPPRDDIDGFYIARFEKDAGTAR